MNPRWRVIAKVGAFLFALFFVFFFVVNGLRYTQWVGFTEQSGYYEAQFWSDNEKISFNDVVYTATNRKLQLYNVENGCYKVLFRGTTKTHCMQNGHVYYDVLLSSNGTTWYDEQAIKNCPGVQRQWHGTYSIENLTFSRPIKAVFIARDIQFLQIEDQLLACTPDYVTCNEIAKIWGEPICSVPEGIVYNEDGKLSLLQLK